MTILTSGMIAEEMVKGNIYIDPLEPSLLAPESYDVRAWEEVYLGGNLRTGEGVRGWINIRDGYQTKLGDVIVIPTLEFIGAAPGTNITTRLCLKSTASHFFLMSSGGKGETGFMNRWRVITVAIAETVLQYGMVFAQVEFSRTDLHKDDIADYAQGGSWQSSSNMAKVKAEWTKESLIPKGLKVNLNGLM